MSRISHTWFFRCGLTRSRNNPCIFLPPLYQGGIHPVWLHTNCQAGVVATCLTAGPVLGRDDTAAPSYYAVCLPRLAPPEEGPAGVAGDGPVVQVRSCRTHTRQEAPSRGEGSTPPSGSSGSSMSAGREGLCNLVYPDLIFYLIDWVQIFSRNQKISKYLQCN